MSRTFKIYTAGKMGGLTYEQQMGWRKQIETLIRNRSDANVVFVHPPEFYRYGENLHKSEAEAMEWDLAQIKDSDIVIVDLSTIADSTGTHIELGVANVMNQFGYKHIHIIGVGKPNTEHPWIPLCLLRQEDELEDAADYISDYLLI